MLNLPVDGFTLNTGIRYWPYQFTPGALEQMNNLRRANLYRPRWFVVPDDFNQPIPAYGTLEYQIKCGPASYLWGYRFIQVDPEDDYAQVTPGSIYIQMTDSCTGIPLFSEFVNGDHACYQPTTPQSRRVAIPYLMTQPRLILEPGLVNVELSSVASTNIYCQLMVCIAEPCSMVESEQSITRRL